MKKIEMKPGKTIFKAGEPADGLYIVGSGEVGIYFPTNKEMAEPDIILKANEILGEMGVIDTAPRMATAKALTDCIVIFVSQKEFEKKLDEGDMIVKAIDAGHTDLAKTLAKTRTMNKYDNGKHKWLSPFEAAQLFA